MVESWAVFIAKGKALIRKWSAPVSHGFTITMSTKIAQKTASYIACRLPPALKNVVCGPVKIQKLPGAGDTDNAREATRSSRGCEQVISGCTSHLGVVFFRATTIFHRVRWCRCQTGLFLRYLTIDTDVFARRNIGPLLD